MNTFSIVLTGVLVSALPVCLVLLFVNAPYGKHDRRGWGPGVGPRLGWFLMEFPALASFLWFYVTGPHADRLLPLLFCALFAGHYIHRSLVYPLQIRPARGAQVRFVIILLANVFNVANGYLNGAWLSRYGVNFYDSAWMKDPRFLAGIFMFVVGLVLNKHSDAILQKLRSTPEAGYGIPYGGGFRLVSNPHYLGELVQWSGFALASWSPAAGAFVLFSAANLVPRAIATHRWYRNTFADYPKRRKAIVPFVL